MHITPLASSSPGVVSEVKGWQLVANRVWTSVAWGEPCVHDATRFREPASEGDEPP